MLLFLFFWSTVAEVNDLTSEKQKHVQTGAGIHSSGVQLFPLIVSWTLPLRFPWPGISWRGSVADVDLGRWKRLLYVCACLSVCVFVCGGCGWSWSTTGAGRANRTSFGSDTHFSITSTIEACAFPSFSPQLLQEDPFKTKTLICSKPHIITTLSRTTKNLTIIFLLCCMFT